MCCTVIHVHLLFQNVCQLWSINRPSAFLFIFWHFCSCLHECRLKFDFLWLSDSKISHWCWTVYDLQFSCRHKMLKLWQNCLKKKKKVHQCQSMLKPLRSPFCCLKENLKPSLSSSHSYSELDDRCRLIFFHIHLCSLWVWHDLCSPSHLIITLFLPLCPQSLFSLLSPSFLLHLPFALCLALSFLFFHFNLPPLLPLCRALCPMGIRVAQQTTSATARRGKLMRRSSWQTMWGCFHNTVKCLNNWRAVSPNSSASPRQIRPLVSV